MHLLRLEATSDVLYLEEEMETKQVFRRFVDAFLVMGADSDLFHIVCYPGLSYEFVHHNILVSTYLVVNSQAILLPSSFQLPSEMFSLM